MTRRAENSVRFCHNLCVITTIVLTSWLVGCSEVPVPAAKATTGRVPLVAEVPGAEETVRGSEEPPVVKLNLGPRLNERRLKATEDLPGSIIVPTTNLTAVPVTAALQAVLTGTDVSLSWNTGAFDTRLVTVANLSGALPSVVDKICASAKVFCSYHHGMLELEEKETFIVSLPTVPVKGNAGSTTATAANNTMADAITELAGEKVKIDQQGGNIIYTTDVEGQERVREYLRQLRNGRPLLVMQLYIWEVTLNREHGTGINWSSFSIDKMGNKIENLLLTGSTSFTSLTSPGVSLGATMAGQVDAKAVIQFLSTQGQVQTISNPQLTFISGSNAEFRVGGKQRYISQVGQLTTTSASGSSSSTSGVGTNTVSTDSIDTGLTVTMGGAYENGVIFALLELTTQDLVSLNATAVDELTIDLPETSERKVSTTLRVRPGDNLVLAGLVTSRDTNDREGIPLPWGGRLTTTSDDQFKNSELVILVKPSVVLFSESDDPDLEKAKDKAKGKTVDAAKPSLDAVLIDKDGSTTIRMPEGASVQQPVSLQATAAPVSAAPVTPEPTPAPIGNVPIAPSEDGAPVDKRLLQRGFSHAYDELLAPSSTPVSLMSNAKESAP